MNSRLYSLFALVALVALALPTLARAQERGPLRATGGLASSATSAAFDSSAPTSTEGAIQLPDGRARVIVELSEPPLATYAGGVPGLNATRAAPGQKLDANSPAAAAYLNHLAEVQRAFVNRLALAAPSATVDYRYSVLFNGVAVALTPSELQSVAKLEGVRAIYPDELFEAQMDASLDLINAPEMWAALGGQSNAGAGVKVAIVDSGLRPDNPMFSGKGFLQPMPAGYPKGYCAEHPDDPDFQCSNKIIAARYYTPTFSGVYTGEVLSPLGIDGHGSHTAGTAVGNPVIANAGNGVLEELSGVAPAAYLMVYKALWGNWSDGSFTASCSTSMCAAALEGAVMDGADVVNNSWGGGAGGAPTNSAYTTFVTNAVAAGVVMVMSAGNSGPGDNTVGCPGCIEAAITVGMSTTNRLHAMTVSVTGPGSVPATLQAVPAVPATGSPAWSPLSAPLRYAGTVAADNAEGCEPFPAGSFDGTIAVVMRGGCFFVDKTANVADAGAIAILVVTNQISPPFSMNLAGESIPGAMVTFSQGMELVAWLAANPDAPGTVDPTVRRLTDDSLQDILDSGSSRGPNGDADVLKPDLVAPGVNILSAFSPDEPPSLGRSFAFLTGTSMASPHVAGSAALLLQQHPDWTPAQIKTALTSTSVQGVRDTDGSAATPFEMGAGRLDLGRAVNAGATFDKPSFAEDGCIVRCSWVRTIRNELDSTATWTASTLPGTEGLAITVEPSSATLAPGASAQFTVTADLSRLAQEAWHFGEVIWAVPGAAAPEAHMPLAVYALASTDALALTKVDDASEVEVGETIHYTITVANSEVTTTTFTLTDPIPANASYVDGSATGGLMYDADANALTWTGSLSPALLRLSPAESPAGYFSVVSEAAALPCNYDSSCDDAFVNIPGLDFFFNGEHYSTLGLTTNGIAIPGGVTLVSQLTATNQNVPNTASPNNVLALFWDDLDLDAQDDGTDSGSGYWYADLLTDGVSDFYVIEWHNAARFEDGSTTLTFQLWIEAGTDNIWFVYETLEGNLASSTVGVEDATGTQGQSRWFNGAGTPPSVEQDLRVESVQGGSATFTFALTATGAPGEAIVNLAELSHPQGQEQAWANALIASAPTALTVGPLAAQPSGSPLLTAMLILGAGVTTLAAVRGLRRRR